MFNQFIFAHQWVLYFLLAIPLLSIWYIWRNSKHIPTLRMSDTSIFGKPYISWRVVLYHALFGFRMLAIGFIIIALARPQSTSNSKDVSMEGIDIVMAIDVSGSMKAMDFKPNRLEASKDVALNFIGGRETDNVGLVLFAGEAFTKCPLTTDHKVLKDRFSEVKNGLIEEGTAIGDGIATSINRLRNSKAISKVIILLTDGENNRGQDPMTLASLAAEHYGIRIYTIGVGKKGQAPFPAVDMFGRKTTMKVDVNIDEELLTNIAKETNGKYFRATNKKALENIYKEIDQLEKTKIDVTKYTHKHDEYRWFLWFALGLFCIEMIGRYLILKKLI